MNAELFKLLCSAASEVFSETPIYLAYGYGSRVRGTPHPGSDLDVGYYAEAGCGSAIEELDRALVLEAGLCSRTGMNVDLRDLRRAPLELRGRVMVEGKRIYCRDRVKQVNLERDTLARYLDYKTTFERMHAERIRRMASRGL